MLLKIQYAGPGVPASSLRTDADSDLERRVITFLARQHRPGLRSLEIEVNGGIVTIRGSVSTFYEKQLPLQLVQHVAGVVRLIDEVTVKSPPYQRSPEVPTSGLSAFLLHSTRVNSLCSANTLERI